jgi:hypothetical protein
MATYPRSASDAKAHIQDIRRDKGLDQRFWQPDHNVSDLEAALKMYAQLNVTSCYCT